MALSNMHTPAVLMLISLIIGCCGGSTLWGRRCTFSGEDTLELVQEDLSLLLAVTHQFVCGFILGLYVLYL